MKTFMPHEQTALQEREICSTNIRFWAYIVLIHQACTFCFTSFYWHKLNFTKNIYCTVQNCKTSSNAGRSDSAKVAWTLTLLPFAVITYERVTGSVDNPIYCCLQC